MDEFLPKTVHWLLFGFILSGLITSFVPDGFLGQLSASQGILAAAILGVPLYVCASASTPIALGLFTAGMSPGACLVFLLTGPASNAANIPLYIKELGSRTTAVFYGSIFLSACICGYLVDLYFVASDFNISQNAGLQHDHGVHWLHTGGTVLFSVAVLYASYRRWWPGADKGNIHHHH